MKKTLLVIALLIILSYLSSAKEGYYYETKIPFRYSSRLYSALLSIEKEKLSDEIQTYLNEAIGFYYHTYTFKCLSNELTVGVNEYLDFLYIHDNYYRISPDNAFYDVLREYKYEMFQKTGPDHMPLWAKVATQRTPYRLFKWYGESDHYNYYNVILCSGKVRLSDIFALAGITDIDTDESVKMFFVEHGGRLILNDSVTYQGVTVKYICPGFFTDYYPPVNDYDDCTFYVIF